MELNSGTRIENQVDPTPKSQFFIILSASPFPWVLITAHTQAGFQASKNGCRDHFSPSQQEFWDLDVQLSPK